MKKITETKAKEQIIKAAMLRHGYPSQPLKAASAAADRADAALDRWCEALRQLQHAKKTRRRSNQGRL
jgi:hypothetical protein